jgi:hypothetical protein
VQVRQAARLDALPDRPVAPATPAESAAELLCVELTHEGLPMDRAAAEDLVAGFIGPRPRTAAEAAELRRQRDDDVLRHAPDDVAGFDLRSPAQVKSLLRRVGIEVPDTRAWRLEGLRDAHPIVEPLLAWRKAERIGTTYGYGWLDEHLGADGRLRGSWTAADGAAGRMTASAGLHNMPADLRAAVIAEPGHVFVRADLGQIEPRVLAAVSGDRALARAAREDDMYARVARQLGVERSVAKVAMLGAMYGQTTGLGARALKDLRTALWRAHLPRGRGSCRSGGPGPAHPRRSSHPPGLATRARRGIGPRPAQPSRGAGALRAQRAGAGGCGRAVQGVGGDHAGPGSGARCPGGAGPMSSSCTCPRTGPPQWSACSTARCRRRAGGHRAPTSASSPTSPSCAAGLTPRVERLARHPQRRRRASSISSTLVVVAQLRIVICWYSGVPMMALRRLCVRRSLSRSK